MQIVPANGIRMHRLLSGPPEGAPVVFAHALGTDLRVWDALIPLLPPGLRTLRYDLRGHGLSDAPRGDYRIDELAADAAALIEASGFRGAVFVGLSIGGLVGQALAAARPDLLGGLVLSNSAARVGTQEAWAERIAAVRAGGIEAIADGVLGKWFSPRFHAERADELAGWRHMLTRTPLAGYLGCSAAVAGADLREASAGLALPVLAIGGGHDGSIPPESVRETAARIPGARFELIPGAGHIPCVETPEAMAALLAGFLRDTIGA